MIATEAGGLRRPNRGLRRTEMVPPPRLERGTPRSTIWCSNQLSYGGPKGVKGPCESGRNLVASPGDCKRVSGFRARPLAIIEAIFRQRR